MSNSSNLVSIIQLLLFQEYSVLEKVLSKALYLKLWQRQCFVFTYSISFSLPERDRKQHLTILLVASCGHAANSGHEPVTGWKVPLAQHLRPPTEMTKPEDGSCLSHNTVDSIILAL